MIYLPHVERCTFCDGPMLPDPEAEALVCLDPHCGGRQFTGQGRRVVAVLPVYAAPDEARYASLDALLTAELIPALGRAAVDLGTMDSVVKVRELQPMIDEA